MKAKVNYRIKEEYAGTTIWYVPQKSFKILWWTCWDNIGNVYRHEHDAKSKIEDHIIMLENPSKPISYKP